MVRPVMRTPLASAAAALLIAAGAVLLLPSPSLGALPAGDMEEEYKYNACPGTEIDGVCFGTASTTDEDVADVVAAARIQRSYDALRIEEGSLEYDHGEYTCNAKETHRFAGYQHVDNVDSHYQNLQVDVHPDTADTVLVLDNIVQQSSSYRPHYHEPMVHYAARYIVDGDLKRVAFVGGGDSMLLYEILLYPTIEKVIGLEIDQLVTRYAFKRFGTQPHYDDERVEWWYGDATKSLLMLPREYFGSFDLVLVDLSDTVMDVSVTRNLDIFGALSLLLRPGGVIVKNEKFLEQFSRAFPYVVQIHYYDVPIICCQSFILGSYDVDFLTVEPKKSHRGDDDDDVLERTLYMKRVEEMTSRYDLFHDYRKNVTKMTTGCERTGREDESRPDNDDDEDEDEDEDEDDEDEDDDEDDDDDDEDEDEDDEQTSSPGILLILEAEDATAPLEPIDRLKDSVVDCLERAGLSVLDAVVVVVPPARMSDGGRMVPPSMIGVALKEGYVVTRAFAEHKYVAFDLHLWGGYDKLEFAEKALIESVGSGGKSTSSSASSSASSFRIVAGGMFGANGWIEDERKRGPVYTRGACDESNEEEKPGGISREEGDVFMDQRAIDTVTTGLLPLLVEYDIDVIVVCGEKGEPCESLNALANQSPRVRKAVPIWTCHEIGNDFELILACEEYVRETIETSVEEANRLGAVIVDPAAPLVMGQILHKLFADEEGLDVADVFAEERMLVALSMDVTETWRRAFLDRFRRDIFSHDPTFRAEVLLNSTNCRMELGVVSSGDEDFFEHFLGILSKIEKHAGLVSDVRNIQGANFTYQSDPFEPKLVYKLNDYDMASSLEQWKSQRPVGVQTIFQLEVVQEQELFFVGQVVHAYSKGDAGWYQAQIKKINRAEDSFDIIYLGDEEEETVKRSFLRHTSSSATGESAGNAPLTSDQIKKALELALVSTKNTEMQQTHEFNDVGEGSLFLSFWSGGSASVLWDGRVHVDVNLFTYKEGMDTAHSFLGYFIDHIPTLKVVLRDMHPRGFGRVVNYARDIEEANGALPLWSSRVGK